LNKSEFTKSIYLIMAVAILGVMLIGCKKIDPEEVGGETYTANAAGYGGDVTIDLIVAADGKINSIKVDAPKEAPEIGGAAIPIIAKQIIATQSLSIDAVSGATITSTAVLTATENALKEAGIDTESLKNK
jgi:fumarate reductase flavoprotein subunit